MEANKLEPFMTKEDICAHLGDDYYRFMGAIVPPIFQNSLFVQPTEVNNIVDQDYVYTRINNPTTEIAEKKIAALEEGEDAKCFSSGMAAISSAIMYYICKDCHVICVENVYGPTRDFLENYLSKFGVETTFVQGDDIAQIERAIRKNTKLIFLESPSSFIYSMQDLEKVAKLAKAYGIGTIIDNTYSTPLFQNPIVFGIDMVVHTASKYLGGHSDIVAGAIVSTKEIMVKMAQTERALFGGNMDPHQAWLLIRGMRTLPVRIMKHQENAMKVAGFLESHSKINQVFYPGLKSHPQYELGKKQMSGYTGLLSFVPKGSTEDIIKFANNLRYFQNGCSWGGFESLVAKVGVGRSEEELKKMCIPNGLVRIHVGLENVDTLIEDLDRSLGLIK
jgi:cystathionine beta-lyase/cystathionine gamma-synthase